MVKKKLDQLVFGDDSWGGTFYEDGLIPDKCYPNCRSWDNNPLRDPLDPETPSTGGGGPEEPGPKWRCVNTLGIWGCIASNIFGPFEIRYDTWAECNANCKKPIEEN